MDKRLERKKQSVLKENIEPVVEGLGFSVVEFTSSRNRSNLSVNLIIYKEDGINLDDCSTVYKTVLPRIELVEDTRNVHLEVSSPGISRNVKTVEEFEIFNGKKIRILKYGDSEWIHGTIKGTGDNHLELNVSGNDTTIDFDDINKAKLE